MLAPKMGRMFPAPLAAELGRLAAQAGYVPGRNAGPGDKEPALRGWEEIAARTGVSVRRLQNLGRQVSVDVDTVDRLLIRAGSHPHLVYGPLPPLREPDWCREECAVCGAHLRTPAVVCGLCEAEEAER